MLIAADSEDRKAKGLCTAAGCHSKARDTRRNGAGGIGRFCHKHEHKHRLEKDPHKYYYAVLRRNARRRKHDFTISLQDFRDFCDATGYIDTRGRLSRSVTIDRIDPHKGYEVGNMQILTCTQNNRKRWIDERLDARYGRTWREPPIDMEEWEGLKPIIKIDPDDPCPF